MLLRAVSKRFATNGMDLAKRVLSSGNCFETFESEPTFDISKDELKLKMRQMQMTLHPDRSAMESNEVKELFETASAKCNDDYNEITSDFLRAATLLRIETNKDIFDENRTEEINKLVTPEFMTQALTLRMSIENAIEDEDEDELRELSTEVTTTYANLIDLVGKSHRDRNFADLEKHIIEANYYRKMLDRIHETLPPS
eukprot:TRINITY_DN20598_c0_g1_i2.p1 TRINITY_DN20598_c0_g1~~TRINITY_DN20598_c0_g1_i2.p1  ORF type:complete len:199 (+),score=37.28 TRINITY_DN20598_c0_g1_i2:239-835(+)